MNKTIYHTRIRFSGDTKICNLGFLTKAQVIEELIFFMDLHGDIYVDSEEETVIRDINGHTAAITPFTL